MTWFATLSWSLLAVGLGAGGWFIGSWGRLVRHPFSLAAFDAGGWVYAFMLIYLNLAVAYLVYGVPTPDSVWLGVSRLLLGALLDVVMVTRVVLWQRLRAEQREASPVPEGRQ